MGIGIGVALILLGLICVLGTSALPEAIVANVDGDTLGWVLVIVGVLAIMSIPARTRSQAHDEDAEPPRVPAPRAPQTRTPAHRPR